MSWYQKRSSVDRINHPISDMNFMRLSNSKLPYVVYTGMLCDFRN